MVFKFVYPRSSFENIGQAIERLTGRPMIRTNGLGTAETFDKLRFYSETFSSSSD